MTTADDRQTLLDYADWQETLSLGDPDTSIEAFLKHRESEANTSRVERALASFDEYGMAAQFERIADPTQFEREANRVLADIRQILESDRPWIEDASLTGPNRRTYL